MASSKQQRSIFDHNHGVDAGEFNTDRQHAEHDINYDEIDQEGLSPNAEISQDDMQYLQTLEQKLSSKKLNVKAQPFLSTTYSNTHHMLSPDTFHSDPHHHNVFTENQMLYSAMDQNLANDFMSEGGLVNIGQQTPFTDQLRIQHTHALSQEVLPMGNQQYTQMTQMRASDIGNQSRKVRWTRKEQAIEKLVQSNKDHYMEVARIFKQMEEKKECTFKPKVNQEGRRYEDVQDLFERLHQDHARRDINQKFKQEQKIKQEVQQCTFTPHTQKNSQQQRLPKEQVPQIYDKLYSDFDKLQRKKLKQQYDREAKIKEELTFKPNILSQTITPKSSSNNHQHQFGDTQHLSRAERSKNRFEMLYSDYIRRHVELQNKINEQLTKTLIVEKKSFNRSTSINASKAHQSIDHGSSSNEQHLMQQPANEKPRYLALYEQSKEKEQRQKMLEIKVNREEGVTFQPLTYRKAGSVTRCSSANAGRKEFEYPKTAMNSKAHVSKITNRPPRPK
ncbi:hypothetical protein FGO68_gene661 [Halteria grandinella]|uniref:Uncharacterized protein n=1 Tax=Halteria grandinella TaxID=5974 RepID=A0A8J8NSI0_HALGN|nr:hypothetical protein FGO68_gene661 [Halteria grandinella]